tara:strand:+ start:50 stop:448 length:399 start_codon:yes stop_codon:yes gene_type:complete
MSKYNNNIPLSTFQVTNESIFIPLNDNNLLEKVNNIFDEHVNRVNKRRKTTGTKARESLLWRQNGDKNLLFGFKGNNTNSSSSKHGKKSNNNKNKNVIKKRSKKEIKLNRSEVIAAYRKMKAAKNKQFRNNK